MSLILYTNPMSRGRIVRWMLEEIGQPYEVEIITYGEQMKGREYLAINPMGKVPALRHGEVIVTETAAIIAYLADAFPEAGLAPAHGSKLRGPYYRWLFFAAACLEGAVLNRILNVTVPPEQAGAVGYGSYEKVVEVLTGAVSQSSFILGKEFSAADVYVGSLIGFGLRFGWFDKIPEFKAYYGRIHDRPAALRAAALDDALIPPPVA